mgnify:CR=1 FL=1
MAESLENRGKLRELIDKLQYIEKLKSNRSSLQADLATKQQYIDDFEKMLNTYDFSDIQSLEKFLEENRKEK